MGNPVVHFEISGPDGGALRRFYAELFGWHAEPVPGNDDYGLVPRDGNTTAAGVGIGGALSGVPRQPSSTWRGPCDGHPGQVTFYVEVADVAAALHDAERLGGRTMLGPDALPTGQVIGLFADPAGHLLGVVSQAT